MHDLTVINFNLVPACDRQTDGHAAYSCVGGWRSESENLYQTDTWLSKCVSKHSQPQAAVLLPCRTSSKYFVLTLFYLFICHENPEICDLYGASAFTITLQLYAYMHARPDELRGQAQLAVVLLPWFIVTDADSAVDPLLGWKGRMCAPAGKQWTNQNQLRTNTACCV